MKNALALLFVIAMMAVGTTAGSAPGDAPGDDAAQPRDEWTSGLDELADRLLARERALDRREKSIGDRESDLRDAEASLRERLEELRGVRTQIEAQLASLGEREEARRMGITKMVEQMRAKDAAPFVVELDQELAIEVLSRMSTSKAGKALAEMSPANAARLAEALSERVEVSAP